LDGHAQTPDQCSDAQAAISDLELALLANTHRSFLDAQLIDEVWNFARAQKPDVLHKRGNPFVSQPKLAYGCVNSDGELPLFRFGFDKKDWDKIQPMPAAYQKVCEVISQQFGVQVTHCLANYFQDATAHYLPAHQDQPFTPGQIRHESQESVYILSLGTPRPLVFVPLTDLGKIHMKDMTVIAETRSGHGDLFVLDGTSNSNYVNSVLRLVDWSKICTPTASSIRTMLTMLTMLLPDLPRPL
jgi:hypothetical protein